MAREGTVVAALANHRREETVARVLLDVFPALDGDGRVLVAGDRSGRVALALRTRGLSVSAWRRWAGEGGSARPWPPEGPFPMATLRLAHARVATLMALHAVLDRLEPGGRLWVHGAGDEGIRSMRRPMQELMEDVEVVSVRRHCRVLSGRRGDAGLRAPLAAWREVGEISLPGGEAALVRYPGVFARGGLDPASAALIAALPPPAPNSRVLDFACGVGVLGLTQRQAEPTIALDLLDADAVAAAAARENVPGARVFLGDGWRAVPADARYDRIISNPPLHRGKSRDDSMLKALIAETPRRLRPGGALWLVTQRTIPVQRWLKTALGSATLIQESRRFRVWRGGR